MLRWVAVAALWTGCTASPPPSAATPSPATESRAAATDLRAPVTEVRPPATELPGAATGLDARSAPSALVADPGPPPAPPAPAVVRFLAVGDTLLTHRVGRAIAATGDPAIAFGSLSSLLGSVDFTFANLEAPLEGDSSLDGLVRHRFTVVDLANNHIMDDGLAGLTLTLAALRAKGIATVGAGTDLDEAWRPAVVRVRGVTIGFLGASFTSQNTSRLVQLPNVARIDQHFRAGEAVRALRERVDVVVVAMHAGIEYVPTPMAEQIAFAHRAIDNGADLVIGHHPHVVQGVETYRGGHVFYSLGNFVFDQDAPPAVLESAAVLVEIDAATKKVGRVEVVPLVNPDTLTPSVAPPDVAKKILRRMGLRDPVIANRALSP